MRGVAALRHKLKMLSLSLVVCLILAETGQQVAATPLQDAEFIVDVQMGEVEREARRLWFKTLLFQHVEEEVIKLGATVVDPVAVRDAIPDQAVDPLVRTTRDRSVEVYLDALSEKQLSDLAAFYRTPAGKMLLYTVHAGHEFLALNEVPITSPASVILLEPNIVASVLSPEERAQLAAFVAGPTWTEIARQIWKVGLAFLTPHFEMLFEITALGTGTEADFVLAVMEEEGAVSFPNPIARNDVLERLRSERDQGERVAD